MPLTVRQIVAAKPQDKDYKLTDGQGLYLLVKSSGAKYWRLKYRFAGKEKKLSIGIYPDISLAQARLQRDEARRCIAGGGDPSQEKQVNKRAQRIRHASTFKHIADEWLAFKGRQWGAEYKKSTESRLVMYIFPALGKRPVTDIVPLEVLECLRRIEQTGRLETMRKTRQACIQIFAYAIVTGRATFNPADYLSSALESPVSENHLSLSEAQLPDFLRDLSQSQVNPLMQQAVRLMLLTGLRTVELRMGRWDEIDFDKGVWDIPAARMKMRRPHLVPLSLQALEVLAQVNAATAHFNSPYIFPGVFRPERPRARRAINYCLIQLGWLDKTTAHGFRHTLSTVLHDHGFNTAWIELQLAHVDKNTIRGTYNHALYLEDRREMLQWYADYLDSLGDCYR